MGLVKLHLFGERADLDAIAGFLLNTEPVVKFPLLVYKSKYHSILILNEPAYLCYMDFFIESDPEVVQEVTPLKPELPPEYSDC